MPKPIHKADYAARDFVTVAEMLENIVLNGIAPVAKALRKCAEDVEADAVHSIGAMHVSEENLYLCGMLIATAHTIVLAKQGEGVARGFQQATDLLQWLLDAFTVEKAAEGKPE